ncbi:MAG: hypothetical protein WC373_12865 [Smithella sp.]|jgi:hypothetical protein
MNRKEKIRQSLMCAGIKVTNEQLDELYQYGNDVVDALIKLRPFVSAEDEIEKLIESHPEFCR